MWNCANGSALEVRAILKQKNATAILVTHDQHEAFAIADEIAILHQGVIQQWDSAYRLYHEPANRFVADFIGEGVFIPGTVLPDKIEIERGTVPARMPENCCIGCTVDVLVRPDDIVHDDASPMVATVVSKALRGAEFLYTLQLASGARVLSLVPSHHNHALGEKIGIKLEIDHMVAFSAVGRAAPHCEGTAGSQSAAVLSLPTSSNNQVRNACTCGFCNAFGAQTR